MKVLLLNAGSGSLKCTLTESDHGAVLASRLAGWAGTETGYHHVGPDDKEQPLSVSWRGHGEAVRRVLHDLRHADPVAMPEHSAPAAVGHRVVHVGPSTSSVRITPEIRSPIAGPADLAPLHNPPSLAILAAAEAELPGVPHVAVFDTAFTWNAEPCPVS
jgi:acetate kinase